MGYQHRLSNVIVALGVCCATSSAVASTGCPSGVVFEPDATGAVVDALSGVGNGAPLAVEEM
jgi:hypothetical protein